MCANASDNEAAEDPTVALRGDTVQPSSAYCCTQFLIILSTENSENCEPWCQIGLRAVLVHRRYNRDLNCLAERTRAAARYGTQRNASAFCCSYGRVTWAASWSARFVIIYYTLTNAAGQGY